MFPKINPKQLEKAMKQMGVRQEEIDATEVVIKTHDKELVIRNPHVTKVNMMGQESIQITGSIEERDLKPYNKEDVKTVMEQAGCSEEKAKEALEKSKGDLAEAILSLKQ
ncbi:MAG: nascent polypeptide-associated complex protein [Nanoarchaeota archaeon]|nr:nascent polypeptide-associated complex protein [Nanoarchaeota archaeon]